MNESERSSQVSALFDGELDAAQTDLVTRRLLKEPALQASWGRYALIGASLRGELLSSPRALRGDIASRVRGSLVQEAPLAVRRVAALAPAADSGSGRLLAWGSALAAGVAVVAILVLRAQAPSAPGMAAGGLAAVSPDQPLSASVTARQYPTRQPVLATDTAAPSYTTPTDDRPAGARLAAPLVNYVVAHSEYTTPVARFSPLSTVMTGNFDPAENTVEMTEAEVGARR
jgi:negative regulator of sigma E activity